MPRHISSGAEHPQTKQTGFFGVFFFVFGARGLEHINWFCIPASVCMQHRCAHVFHVTGRPTGACSSSCWGWIVRDESGDLWPGQSLMMKPSLFQR